MLVEIGSAGGNKFLNVFWKYLFGLNVCNLWMTGDMEICMKEPCTGPICSIEDRLACIYGCSLSLEAHVRTLYEALIDMVASVSARGYGDM